MSNFDKTIWPGSTQLAPVPAVLVGCGGANGFKNNVLTVAWAGIICSDAPMLSIAVRPERYSYKSILDNGCFTVNMASAKMAADVDYCGVVSGRDHDKFAERNLTPVAGSKVSAPIIAECPLSLECEVVQMLPLGAHHLFLAKIVAVQVTTGLLDAQGKFDPARADLLAYAHGGYYRLGEYLGHFGFSVRKK